MVEIKFEDNTNKILGNWEHSKKPRILKAIGGRAIAIWRKIIRRDNAIDTGYFIGTVNFKVNKGKVTIGSPAPYAPYLELGTSKMKKRPMLRETIEQHNAEYKKIAENIMKD